MTSILSQFRQKKGSLTNHILFSLHFTSLSSSSSSPPPPPPPPPPLSASSSGSKISPSILLIIVILAVIFFISSVLHLVVKFLTGQRSSSLSESNRIQELNDSFSYRRQLQQLFHLHDSGLDQAFIDALPVFFYKEIVGLQEPLDCAVCLCEFSVSDKLRLLPMCCHAFHIDCIDTWLLSNSTCPLCRGSLYTPGFTVENLAYDCEDLRDGGRFLGNSWSEFFSKRKPEDCEIDLEKRVFSVRLGKFKSLNNGGEKERGEEGEEGTSRSDLGGRRCYSMGSYQYVVDDSDLRVALCPNRVADGGTTKERSSEKGIFALDENDEGKKLNFTSKNESFSVSKIWQWSKKGKYPSIADPQIGSSSVAVSLQPQGAELKQEILKS